MSGGGNSVYSPLPQSNSDTESSEEELHSLQEAANRGHVALPNSKPMAAINNSAVNGVKTYKQLDNDVDISVALNGRESNVNVMTIVKPVDFRSTPMSPVRECVFIFSILFCFFTIIVFLWILPCDWDTCPAKIHDSKQGGWERIIQDFELLGTINVAQGKQGSGYNLIVLTVTSGGTQAGVLALVGGTGAVAWNKKLHHQPKDMDCSVLDTNGDGILDCIILVEDLLLAVHPSTGTTLWSTQTSDVDSRSIALYNIQFPLILPDLDGDNIGDLVVGCGVVEPSDPANVLVIISGNTGQVLGQPFKQTACSQVTGLYLEKDFNISFTCTHSDNKAESLETVTLGELFLRANLSHSLMRLPGLLGHVAAPKQHDPATPTTIGSRHVILKNEGQCPQECKFQLIVRDEQPGQLNKTVTILSMTRAYAMAPVIICFPKPNVSALILKYWQWQSPRTNYQQSDNSFLREVEKEQIRGHAAGEVTQLLAERVVLIIFNETEHHTVDASQLEVRQLCRRTGQEDWCQPSLHLHTRSMIVADLDQDGSQELVSFTSTYIADSQNGNWKLESKVQVVRLGRELHQLYETTIPA